MENRPSAHRRPTPFLPDDLVIKILSYLPLKDLMRLKAVCRNWMTMIGDRALARSWRGGFKGIIIVKTRLGFGSLVPELKAYRVSIERKAKPITSQTTLIPTEGGKVKITQQINGLLCLYSSHRCYLHNIATKELLPLTSSDSDWTIYHFGFDPRNQSYKLIRYKLDKTLVKKRQRNDSTQQSVCQILSFREGADRHDHQQAFSWKSVKSPSTESILVPSVCYEGNLYWISGQQILGFDLSTEGFFYLPNQDLKKLLVFGERLSLWGEGLIREDRRMWVVVSVFDKKMDGKIDLDHPREIVIEDGIRPNLSITGVMPEGELLMYQTIRSPRNFYLYDPDTRRFNIRRIHNPSALPSSSLGEASYFEENLISLAYFVPD